MLGTSQDAAQRPSYCHIPLAFLAFNGPEPQAGVGYSTSAPSGLDPLAANSDERTAAREGQDPGHLQARKRRAAHRPHDPAGSQLDFP